MHTDNIFSQYGHGFESVGLRPVLSYTENSCIASYCRQFSTNIEIKIMKLIPVLKRICKTFILKGP